MIIFIHNSYVHTLLPVTCTITTCFTSPQIGRLESVHHSSGKGNDFNPIKIILVSFATERDRMRSRIVIGLVVMTTNPRHPTGKSTTYKI